MSKKEGNKKGSVFSSGCQSGMTLREEISGRKRFVASRSSNNVKSILKMQHLQNLAIWASREASIPSLSALYGHHLAACGEAMGTPLDPSLFPCQRCESILQPGYNCTVRIEKNVAKARRRRKKSVIPTQNNVAYTCHFCSHLNLKRGTPEGHMKEICTSKPKSASQLKPVGSTHQKTSSMEKEIRSREETSTKMEEISSKHKLISESTSNSPTMPPVTAGEISIDNYPVTPLVRTGSILLEGKRKRKKRTGSVSNKSGGIESSSTMTDAEHAITGSSKRKRKSWSSLKDIVESSQRGSTRKSNLTIPFFL